MEAIKHISSPQNALIKKALLLKEKSRERKKTGLFILEGLRELQIAVKAGYKVETVFCCIDIIKSADSEVVQKKIETSKVITVTSEVYQKIAHRNTTEGILAIVESKNHHLDSVELKKKNPLILVAEAPEKPGNIGALLRTADAANLDAVLIANPKTDLYNPNIIRSSVGCLFSSKVAYASTEEIIYFLKKKEFNIYCAALSASKEYTLVDYNGATAIVVGTEDNGLSKEWLESATQNIIIPMEGEIDSMNVSVAAAILIFEGKRQRNTIS